MQVNTSYQNKSFKKLAAVKKVRSMHGSCNVVNFRTQPKTYIKYKQMNMCRTI